VRSSSTPVYEEDSPADQESLRDTIVSVLSADDGDLHYALVRFAAVGALSGRPDIMEALGGLPGGFRRTPRGF
jgi:hypothetical protein